MILVVWPPAYTSTSVPRSKVEYIVCVSHTQLALVLVRTTCQSSLSEQPVRATSQSNLSEWPCQCNQSEQPCHNWVVFNWHIALTTRLCMELEWMDQRHGPTVVVYCVAWGLDMWINVPNQLFHYLYGLEIGCYFSWPWQLHVGSM